MKIYIFFLVLMFNSLVFSQESIIDFFKNLYVDYPDYVELRKSEFNSTCLKFSLDSLSSENQSKFYNIYFLHDLFTGTSAQNFVSGGILRIPYFWHWVEPNPRHEIFFLSKSKNLNTINPPLEFSKYKSYADIDRIPHLFLSDLFTEEPKYYHEQCSNFYTFGWCSEREMAYNTLLGLMDLKLKIKQDGIHTWSEIYTKFKCKNAESKNFIIKVDNTFDNIEFELSTKGMTLEKWQKDIGQGSTINWYNKKAHSETEVEKVQNIQVNKKASKRIRELIKTWINNK